MSDAWDGRPQNPDLVMYHWLVTDTGQIHALRWAANEWDFGVQTISPRGMASSSWRYLGPCLTPAEIAAQVEAARREEREACAATAEREMRELFGDADEYQQGWNAGLEAGAAAIRARGDA